jgi:anti-sigma factor RsiW
MMKCAEVDDNLEAYVEGDLGPEPGRRLESHVAGCPGCREKLGVAREIASGLRSLPARKCPGEIEQRVFEKIESEKKGWESRLTNLLDLVRFPISLKAAAGLATTLLILLALWVYPPWSWIRNGSPQYTEEEVARAKKAITIAFGYVDHASELAREILVKEDIPGKVLQPIRKGFYGPDHSKPNKGDQL